MSRQADPDSDQWYLMRLRGKEVADMARQSKKYGTSTNLKGKIVSYLRIALQGGIDLQAAGGGQIVHPSKADVTAWANFQAGEIMRRTSDDRRSNRMSDFGYAVANAQKDAFRKGWSLAAGRTELAGTEGSEPKTSTEALARVPSKYQGAFEMMMFDERRNPGMFFIIQTSFSRWSHCVRHDEGLKISHHDISSAGVAALIKAGMITEMEASNPDGRTIGAGRLSDEALKIAGIYHRLREKELEVGRERLREIEALRGDIFAGLGFGR